LELAHARFPVAQPVHQLDPHRLAEHSKALGDKLDQRIGQWVWHVGHSQIERYHNHTVV
jgi:hypothetical protein